MKWQTVLKGWTLVGVAAAIVGCRTEPEVSRDVVTADINRTGPVAYTGDRIEQWTDPESGCAYLVVVRGIGQAIAITPKLDASGMPWCLANQEAINGR